VNSPLTVLISISSSEKFAETESSTWTRDLRVDASLPLNVSEGTTSIAVAFPLHAAAWGSDSRGRGTSGVTMMGRSVARKSLRKIECSAPCTVVTTLLGSRFNCCARRATSANGTDSITLFSFRSWRIQRSSFNRESQPCESEQPFTRKNQSPVLIRYSSPQVR